MKKNYITGFKKSAFSLMVLFCFSMPFFGHSQTVTTYDRTGWTVSTSSEESSGELPNGPATKILDGDNASFWSSQWANGTPNAFAHTLVFDMQVAQPVNKLYYVPRNSYNSVPTKGSVAFGDDGTTFGSEIPITFATNFAQSTITLPSVQNHRYFRITITQNQHTRDNSTANDPVSTMAEIGAIYDTNLTSTLTSFTAQSTATVVNLNWSTSSEANSASYTVKRSSDALNFTTIATIPATANTTAVTNYSYTDTAPVTGFNFYKLELVRQSGPTVAATDKSSIANSEFPFVSYSSNQTKNLNVFYFIPNDQDVAPDFKNRLDALLINFQTYCGTEMQRSGYGNKTFGLVTDATHTKINLIIINGNKPKSAYPYDTPVNGGNVAQVEVDAYIASHPSSFYGNHNLVIFPVTNLNANGAPNTNYPYYGLGKNCYAVDFGEMKLSNLGVGGNLGTNATTYIGGLYHELGHGINLPHNRLQTVTQAALGTSLMSFGNYTWGLNSTSVTSLTDLDCAILNRNQIFNNDGINYYGPGTASVSAINACYDGTKKAIIYSGTVTSTDSPVISVGFHNDRTPDNTPSAYDASWAAQVTTGNKFYIEEKVNDFVYSNVNNQGYRLELYLIQKNGTIVTAPYLFTFVNGIPVLTPAIQPITATITASADVNGSISPSGATIVNCAGNLTYTITPNSGYAVQNVLVDGVAVGAVTTYTFTNVVSNHTITATFSLSSTLGNELFNSSTISLYPNPIVNNQFTLALPASISGNVMVTISNMLGQTVYTTSQNADSKMQISPENKLQEGIYIVSISNNENLVKTKIVVKK